MKHKSSKRSIPNKQYPHPHYLSYQNNTRRLSISLTPIDATTIATNKVDLGNGTVHLDSHSQCLKANLSLKNQKVLKRDLLRCSDQRPSLLGPHTLQPPRVYHGSQQMHTTSSPSFMSSSTHHQQTTRRRSLSVPSRTLYGTIDRIGPWPDISISRLRSDGNELLRPLKNFRNLKNPRLFSPKYYAALTEDTSKFKFHSSTRTYIDEYRKQKGYLLSLRTTITTTTQVPSLSLPAPQSNDDQISAVGQFCESADVNNGIARDRTVLTTTDLSIPHNSLTKSTLDLMHQMNNTPPSIPAVTKVFADPHHVNNLPPIVMRNGHLRPTRHPPHHAIVAQQSQHQQAIALPSLTASSLHYISSMSSVEKAYSNIKKMPTENRSKLFLIDGRQRKRIRMSQRINSDSEIAARSQDFAELRATGGPVVTTRQRSTAVVVYQLPRRPPVVTSQSDVGSFS